MTHCIAFEAKSIQGYVLGSGKLKEMVGASRLVDVLVGEPLDCALETLGLKEDENIRFSRRAGGAFMAFVENAAAARRLQDVWSLVVPQYAPGLEFVLATGEGASEREAAADALEKLQAGRFPLPRIPQATPLVRLAPRTGHPAVGQMRTPDGLAWVDGATRAKSRAENDPLQDKFLGGHEGRFPVNMEREFPLDGDNRFVGIVHADGNGLGQMLLALQNAKSEDFVHLYGTFSKMLTEATVKAAQRATAGVALPAKDARGFLPMRPLVLGGDDLTCIVRGDLALEFTRVFLDAFEEETRPLCDFLQKKTDWDRDCLTAGAGIAYVKVNQPFALAYELAEALCGRAKRLSGRNASAVAFHRVTTSFIPDADWILEREMATRMGDATIVATLGAYGLREDCGLPSLSSLHALLRLMAGDGERSFAGAMRQLLGLASAPPEEARRRYDRWRTVLRDRKTGNPELLEAFDGVLTDLLGSLSEELPARPAGEGRYETPLGDVLALQAVGDIHAMGEEDEDERNAA